VRGTFWFLCFILAAPRAFAIQADVEDLSDQAYETRALELIEGAERSIVLSLYEFDFEPSQPRHPGTRFAEALVRAKKRGVSLYLVLNRNYEFQAPGEESIFTRNDPVYAYLRAAGIQDVFFADPGRRVHDKLLIVDGQWVLEGSHNWSHSAMRLNRESSALIRSREYASIKEARVRALKRLEEGEVPEARRIRLPNAFLKDPRYLKRMTHDRDFRALAIYLWLLYESDKRGSPEFEMDLGEMRQGLNLPVDWDTSKARRQLIKVLKKKLAGRYHLLEIAIPHGTSARIRLLPLESKETGWTNLPAALFETGLIKTFSEAALTTYLTGLYLSETSPIHPWWSAPQTGWANLFGISQDVIQEGTKELKRANLLEVIYFGFEQNPFFKDRPTNQYRFNPVFSEFQLERKWRALREKSSDAHFELARRYANELEDPNDPVLVSELLGLLAKYPEAWVEEVMARMRSLRPDNPRKSFDYAEGILEGFAVERAQSPQSF